MSRIPRNAKRLRFETVVRVGNAWKGSDERRTGTAIKNDWGQWIGTYDDEPEQGYLMFVSNLRDDEIFKITVVE